MTVTEYVLAILLAGQSILWISLDFRRWSIDH